MEGGRNITEGEKLSRLKSVTDFPGGKNILGYFFRGERKEGGKNITRHRPEIRGGYGKKGNVGRFGHCP